MEQPIQTAPTYKIYTDKIIYAATFFGGPLAGGYIIAQNYKAFGDQAKYKKTLFVTIAFTVILFTGIFLIPNFEKFPRVVIPIIYTVVVSWFMRTYQGKQISEHINNGGKIYSGWRVVLITLIALVSVFVIAISAAFFVSSPGTEMVVQPYRSMNHELY